MIPPYRDEPTPPPFGLLVSVPPMPPRRKGEKRTRHGTRPLILKVFHDPDAPATLTTTALVERVSKAAGAPVPVFSVYSALRTLVKHKVLRATREGHEKSYALVGPPSAPTHEAPSFPILSGASTPAVADLPLALPPQASPPAPSASTATPHKLAVGEALILHVTEEHVESVTNVHGHLVVERHSRKRGQLA
jgi:hypothetical protein